MNNSKCQFLRSLVLKFKTDNSSAKQCECTILENESFRIECTVQFFFIYAFLGNENLLTITGGPPELLWIVTPVSFFSANGLPLIPPLPFCVAWVFVPFVHYFAFWDVKFRYLPIRTVNIYFFLLTKNRFHYLLFVNKNCLLNIVVLLFILKTVFKTYLQYFYSLNPTGILYVFTSA